MTPVTLGQRIYFAAVGLFALWVGVWGTFLPQLVDRALPWLVPPLHARFLGAFYFSGAVLLFGGVLARHYAEVRIMVRVVALWTGMLLIISLLHWGEFDFHHRPVWFWYFAYVLYPLIALWLMKQHPGQSEHLPGRQVSGWARRYLTAQGLVVTLVALALLFAPAFLTTLWPWKISPLLAQIYSGPFLAYGYASLALTRERTWPGVRLVTLGAWTFATLVLVASGLHRGLFDPTRPATWVWFCAFGLATGMLGAMSLAALRGGEAR